jgi:curli biogenesis system outer membrane secretion channel CsgG
MVVAALIMPCLACWTPEARAISSRDDLIAQMVASLERELPPEIHGIAIMKLDNRSGANLDMQFFQDDLELQLIHSPRFQFVNRKLFEAALTEINLCAGMQCFMDPATMQKFGQAKGIDAMIFGEVIDCSSRHEGLKGKDYFTTVMLRAMGTATASVLWQKEVTGVDSENVAMVLGGLPPAKAVTRAQALGRAVARFLRNSHKLPEESFRTVSLMNFENPKGLTIDMDEVHREIANAIVDSTRFKLVDRAYIEQYLKEHDLWYDRLMEASQRKNLGHLYGIDAFLGGTIREVSEDRVVFEVRVNDLESTVDVDAEKMTAQAANMEWYLPNMLRNVGPTRFTSKPTNAQVTLDGAVIGATPCEKQLTNGDHAVAFRLDAYDTVDRTVTCVYGQGQLVHADLVQAHSLVSIVSRPSGADIQIGGQFKGRAPVTGLTLPYGSLSIIARRDMFKTARAEVRVCEPRHEFVVDLEPKTRSQAVLYSALFPGGGQHYKGQHNRAWLITLGAGAAGGFALLSESQRTGAIDDFGAARVRYEAAVTQADIDAAFLTMESKKDEASKKARQRDLGLYALGSIWLANVIDAALGWPTEDAGIAVRSLHLNGETTAIGLVVWR